ncbi:MAG: hypothetical protein Q9188_005974 [Gyalolechia gomerana]
MARPQRSPRMRDHWRDEGHRREDSVYRGRHRERSSDRRKSSATLKKRERSIDVEVKIKGRATAEEAHNISSLVLHAAGGTGRGHTEDTRDRAGTDTATPAVTEKLLGSALTTGKGRGADRHVEQLLLATESDREARICFIHVILISTSTLELGTVSINILGYHLPVVPTTILSPTRTTHLWVGTSTFLLLGALDTDHLSGKGTEESTVTREDLQCQGLLAPKARTDRLRKRISFIITYQEQGNARLVPLVSLALCRGADSKSHLIEGDLDHVKDPSDRRKD